jgi:hypothetical protein
MILTASEAKEIVWDDHKDWEEVKGTKEIVDQSRWSTFLTAIFHHKSTDKYYRASWSRGSTEGQEESPYENDTEAEFTEVHKVQKMVDVWEETP